jgi:hypothetical protein
MKPDTENTICQWNPKTKALVVAAWFAPWTNLFRWMVKIDNPYVKAAQFVINLGMHDMNDIPFCNIEYSVASGLGTGIALIVAGTSNTEFVAFLGQPITMVGPCVLTMEYHQGFRHNAKYLEYQETIRNRKQRLLTLPKKQ